jgi:hypothetical protein
MERPTTQALAASGIGRLSLRLDMGSNWPMTFMAGLYGVKLESGRDRERREEDARNQASIEDIEHSKAVVAAWNDRAKAKLRPSFFPTIRTALLAGTPVIDVLCTGCRTIGSVDLRRFDYHDAAPISALIPKLSCRRCCPNPPFAILIGLRAGPPRWGDIG